MVIEKQAEETRNQDWGSGKTLVLKVNRTEN